MNTVKLMWISITAYYNCSSSSLFFYLKKKHFLLTFVFAEQQNHRILAVFREWTSSSTNENSKLGADRVSREKIKKMKNLLTENLPAENVVTLE